MPDRRRKGPLIGREAELAVVQKAVDDAGRGRPIVLLVGGDAGIGKTSLVIEGAERADVPCFLGRCVPLGGDAIPFAPLVDVLRQVRRRTPEALEGAELGSLPWREGRPDEVATGDVFLAVLDLLGVLGGDGVALFGFEDLHWADPLTWDLFEFLARNLMDEHVVLVGTYRANEVAADPRQRPRLAELSRLPAVRRIDLAGLSRADVAQQVANILGDTPATGLVDDVAARGQGNPFFTEELVAAHVAGQTVPALLSDLLAVELAPLDESTHDVLAVLATVGRETSHDLLARVSALPEVALEAAVRAALDAQVVVADPATDTYRFRHALFGEVVNGRLLPPQRRRLHRRIAEALRADPALALNPRSSGGELAFHLDQAGDQAGAFDAYLAAADQTRRVAPAAARNFLERALALWPPDSGDRIPRLWQAAELAYATGEEARAVDLARQALSAGEPPTGAARGHERLARYLWAVGALTESATEYERAAALVRPEDRSLDAASVYAGLGEAEFLFCRYESAERWCRRALEVVPTPDVEPRIWLHSRRVLGLARAHRGYPEESVQLAREALEVAESAEDRAFAAIYLAQALQEASRYDEAVTLALDGAAEGERGGLDRSMGGYLSVIAAEALTRRGRWREADNVLSRLAGVSPVPPTALRRSLATATLAARRGDLDRARAELDEAERLPVDPWHRIHLVARTAEIRLLSGEWALAARAADEGWETPCSQDALWPPRLAALVAWASVEQTLDALAKREPADVPATVARLRSRVDEARARAVPADRPVRPEASAQLADATAMITRLTGPDPDAWAAAARAWEEVGDPWATAIARMHEADAAAATGAPARASEALRSAYAVAVELGAAPLVAQIEAVSRRTRLSVEAPSAAVLAEADIDRLGLTPREAEVLGLVAAGKTNREIGEALYVSEKTASVHVSNILRKLGVTSRVDAAAVAQRIGIV
jgi:DNA-binding NarL/FixJ family response regulator